MCAYKVPLLNLCWLLPIFQGTREKITMKLNSPALVDSWAFLLNNGEGGRAGSRLEQSNVWALRPGMAPEAPRWQESRCFNARCEEARRSCCLSSLPVDFGWRLGPSQAVTLLSRARNHTQRTQTCSAEVIQLQRLNSWLNDRL